MKKILPLLFCTACMFQEVQAQKFMGVTALEKQNLQDASFMGPTELKEITAKSLFVTGTLHFNNLKVEKTTEIFGPVTNSDHGVFNSLIITGPFAAKNIACSKLEVTGPVNVTDFQVSGEATIIGSLKVGKSTFQNLTVTGPSKVEKSTFQNLTITGPLKAEKSTIQNLTITADKIVLEDVKIKDIIVKKNQEEKQEKKQVLDLKGETIVEGNITFESGKGVVEQGSEVKIQGKIKGATLEKK